MRGLANLALSLNQAGRYTDALVVCDRLDRECGDDMGAAAHRASAYLCLGEWSKARDAALYVHCISPSEGLFAAMAAYELGDRDNARIWFVHAAMNAPREVGTVLGKRMPRSRSGGEARFHNSGIMIRRAVQGFLREQSTSSRRFFSRLWKQTESLRAELDDTTRKWREDRATKDRVAYERMTEMQSLEFARQWSDVM
jgi:hypothetical protein